VRRIFAALLLALAALQDDDQTSSRSAGGPVAYVVNPAQPWGPKWKRRRPPGLPARARKTADRRSSAAMLESALQPYGDEQFRAVVRGLAATESSTRAGRPANNYDGSNIRAFGVFNWNTLATPDDVLRVAAPGGNRVIHVGWRTVRDPVDWTVSEEFNSPLMTYWAIWRGIREQSGSARDAARGIRIWHRRPSLYKAFLNRAASAGWSASWRQLDREHTAVVDRHLRGIV